MVDADISEVEAALDRANAELGHVARVMVAPVRVAAANERAQHAYRNRTGLLQKNTKASIGRDTRDEAVVVLEMDREYASYVVRRGLSEVERQAKVAEEAIVRELEAMGQRIAGK